MYSKKILIRAEPFCGTGIIQLHAYFIEYICGYLDFTWLVIGTTLNIFNIVVFTRKNMISPNNLIFANLAVVDMAAVIAYMPRAWHEFIRLQTNSVREHRIYEWETVSLHSLLISSIFHGVSIWLTVMLAVWRYIAIVHPLKQRNWCGMRTTRNWIIAGYVTLPLIWIPAYFNLYVGPLVTLLDNDGYVTSNTTIGISTTISKLQNRQQSKLIRLLNVALYGVFQKIVPFVVLTVFSYKLIVALIRAKKRHEMLTAGIYQSQTTIVKTKQSTDRATMMILVVLFLFFVAEIPHGICCLLTAIYGSKFFLGCYVFLYEMFNSLTLICTSVNFIIYYFMSQQFRNTFDSVFHCKIFSFRKPDLVYPENYTQGYNESARSSITTLQSTRTPSVTTISSTHM